MKCQDCPRRKELDAVEIMEGAPEWVCTAKHSATEDVVCLLRMIIWRLYAMDKDDE